MTTWPIPGIPGMAELIRLLQVQSEALTSLPETVLELNRTVRSLTETVETTRETMLSVQRVLERVERVLDEIEDPVTGMRPGLERLSGVLDDPVVERIPAGLEAIENTVLPIAAWAERRRAGVARARAIPGRIGRLIRKPSDAAP